MEDSGMKLPNFAKVALAIVETKLEQFVGADAIKELRVPYDRGEVNSKLGSAVLRAENRFIEAYPESDVSTVLSQLPIADLPSIKLAVANFYDFPTDPKVRLELEKQIRLALPKDFSGEEIINAAKAYFKFIREEIINIDEIRDKLTTLSIFEIQENTLDSTSLLRAIDEKLGVLIEKKQSANSKRQNTNKLYTTPCSSSKPGLALFLVDIGKNTNKLINDVPAINIISDALRSALVEMIQRSHMSGTIANRYNVGCFAYGSDVQDIFGGIKSIEQIAKEGLPELTTQNINGDTFNAFLFVEKILRERITGLADCPAPLVCHITAGEYPGRDPEPIAKRIKSLNVRDGNILVENVLVEDESTLIPSTNPTLWHGIHTENELAKSYARQLYRMSSIIPESYRVFAREEGYNISNGTRMLYPGTQTGMINFGIVFPAVSVLMRVEENDD